MPEKIHLLINLPPTFFTQPELAPYFTRLEELAYVRQTSHNTQEEILQDLPWADAVIMWAWPNLDEPVLNQCPNLRFVGQINTTQATVKSCLGRGIAVSEARHGWSPAVAEMALALILNGLRKVSEYHRLMRAAQDTPKHWLASFPSDIDPLERQLAGRHVGIVGFGGIGQRLAQFLEPFNVTLSVYDPFIPAGVLAKYSAERRPVMDLARNADVVVLCAANQPGAAHVMGKAEIEALRPHAVLVNIGRSMLIDMEALAERLKRGDLIAMLDVFDEEPLPADSPLRGLPNTYLTPHRAGGIMESVERSLMMLSSDLEAFINGEERQYAVTEAMLVSFPA